MAFVKRVKPEPVVEETKPKKEKSTTERKPREKVEKKTSQEIEQDKADRILRVAAKRCAYYRANPHRFVEEFLGIHLKLFQKILIYCMMIYDYFFFIAARG